METKIMFPSTWFHTFTYRLKEGDSVVLTFLAAAFTQNINEHFVIEAVIDIDSSEIIFWRVI